MINIRNVDLASSLETKQMLCNFLVVPVDI